MADYLSPNYSVGQGELPPELLAKTGTNLRSMLAGELPEDVRNMLAQRAAEIGVASGTSGSEFNNYRSLRDLGLTSLDQSNRATAMLAPNFISPTNAAVLSQNKPPRMPVPHGLQSGRTTSAPLASSMRSTPFPSPVGPYHGDTGSTSSLINDLFGKYTNRGGGGGGYPSAPMGFGTMPTNSYNSGPLSTGRGSFYAGARNPSTADLADLGIIDPGFLNPSSNPSNQELADYGLIDPAFDWSDNSDYENWMTPENWMYSSNPYE
jgi:hypothetical protein